MRKRELLKKRNGLMKLSRGDANFFQKLFGSIYTLQVVCGSQLNCILLVCATDQGYFASRYFVLGGCIRVQRDIRPFNGGNLSCHCICIVVNDRSALWRCVGKLGYC